MSSADWKLDKDELKKVFTPRTKAIIFNNPNNPLGKVFSMEEIQEVCNLCIANDVLMISDDVYEHMVFDANKMVRVASLPGMWDRTITIGSAGKTFSVTGWKLGWAYGPDHLIRNKRLLLGDLRRRWAGWRVRSVTSAASPKTWPARGTSV